MNNTNPAAALGKVIGYLLGRWLLTPFLIMVLFGALHSAYHQVPAFGFRPTWFVVVLLIQILGLFRRYDAKN